MTDQPTPGDSALDQNAQAQSTENHSNVQSPEEVAQTQQQAALNTIFNKQNDGVQFGSMPASSTANDSGVTTSIPNPSQAGGQATSIPMPTSGGTGTGGFTPIQPNSSGSFGSVQSNRSGSFTQVASTQGGAIPRNAQQQSAAAAESIAANSSGSTPVNNARPIILFDRVSKVYPAQPNKPALNNISVTISSGEFVFLVGHSGSGKSTFIRLINREFTTSSGRLIVAGEDLSSIKRWRVPYLRRNIGCVFQDFKLLPNKTAFQNVAFALEVIGKSRHIIRTQVPEVLRLVGLEDKTEKFPDQLSGGEQQRVSIARAIVNRPPMLICDEPTGNLDPQTSLGIMRLLDRINRTGTTILVATHDREMVDSMRKRVIGLENGFLVRDEDKGVYGLDA